MRVKVRDGVGGCVRNGVSKKINMYTPKQGTDERGEEEGDVDQHGLRGVYAEKVGSSVGITLIQAG